MDKKNIIFVGIIEEKRDGKTIDIVEDILVEFDYELIFLNRYKNILCVKKKSTILIIVNMEPKNMDIYSTIGIEFDILIHNFIKKEDYKDGLLEKQYTKCKYYVLNSDDDFWTLLPLSSLDGVVITYGFNSKSTLTISSYDISEGIKANLCLQRSITSIFGIKIEPFEFIIELKSKNKDNIYPILAATLLNLIIYDGKETISLYKTIKI